MSGRFVLAGVVLVVVAAGCGGADAERERLAVPSSPLWRKAAPAAEGVDPGGLAIADRRARAFGGVRSLLVARHGRLVYERYYGGAQAADRQAVFSITKSVVSALVGIALADGKLRSVDARLADLLPRAFGAGTDPRARTITVRELLTMTSGFVPSPRYRPEDPVDAYVNRPLFARPGTQFRYDGGSTDLVCAVLARVTGMAAAAFAERRLFRPLGIRGARWTSLGHGVSDGAAGLSLRSRDLLALGQLYLDGGVWRGRRVLPASWIRESTRPHVRFGGGRGYGYFWWTGFDSVPSFTAFGYPGQAIVVFPGLDAVVVVTSAEEDLRPRVVLAGLVVRAIRD